MVKEVSGSRGVQWEHNGGHGVLLGTMGLCVVMGQLQGRCTGSEEVLEGVWCSVGGYRASLGVLLGKHWGGYWGFERMMGGLSWERKEQPWGKQGTTRRMEGNPTGMQGESRLRQGDS